MSIKSKRKENKTLRLEYSSSYREILHRVPIFKKGSITDSEGTTRDFGEQHLNRIAANFKKGKPESVPIKLGHVDSGFTERVAEALGVPKEILEGQGVMNRGAARLGEAVEVYTEEGKLFGDLALHPKVATLVREEFFNSLSIELEFPENDVLLSGIALLGAQRPAVKKLGAELQDCLLEEGALDGVSTLVFASNTNLLLWEMPGNRDLGKSYLDESQYAEKYRGTFRSPTDVASAGSPDDVEWTVPIKMSGGGFNRIDASVSAPDEITAKVVGLRVVENFLLNVGGPLGRILGTGLGGLLIAKFLLGKPKRLGSWGRITNPRGNPPNAGKVKYNISNEVVQKAVSTRIRGSRSGLGFRLSENLKTISSGLLGYSNHPFAVMSESFSESELMALEGTNGDVAGFEEVIKGLEEKVKESVVKALFQEYHQEAVKLSHISGTPEELANSLVRFDQLGGEIVAKDFLNLLRFADEVARESQVCELVLAQGQGKTKDSRTFEEHLDLYKKENPNLSEAQVYQEVAKQQSAAYSEHQDQMVG